VSWVDVRAGEGAELDEVDALLGRSATGLGGGVDAADVVAGELGPARARAEVGTVLVAVLEGRVVGTATVCPPGTPLVGVAGPTELELGAAAVEEDARGRGVGEALVRTALAQAIDLGLTGVVVSTTPPMQEGRELLGRLGFVAVPARDRTTADGVPLQVWARAT
jgi:GNAT superfamily N-acetyltransferase